MNAPSATALAITVGLAVLVAAPASAGQLQIVAHEDDDLYFMTPAVPDGIATGEPSWTVFLTAGDAGRTDGHWQSRELGMRAAYAAMAGVADSWLTTPLDVEGKQLTSFTLAAAPQVRLLFLRLPDGNPNGTGYSITGNESLRYLWEGSIPVIHGIDGSQSYSRTELIGVLREIVRLVDPDTLRIQDMTNYHGSDHSDHYHAGRFAFDAHLASGNRHRLLAYRAYNIDAEPVNLSVDEIIESDALITIYGAFDPGVGPNAWNDREIPIGDVAESHASLVPMSGSASGLCLEVTDAGGPGETIAFATCADVLEQSFFLTERDVRHGDHCLATPALGGSIGSIGFRPCGVGSGQTFTFFSDGHVRGPDGQCLVESAGGLALSSCDGTSRAFEIGAKPAYAATPDFSAGEFGTDPSRYRSLAFGDLDGDGDADACARRSLGIHCALATGGGLFAPATEWHPNFGDDDAWGPPQYGTTIALGDVDGDGLADLCGRGALGIYCVRSTGSTFVDFRLWTTAFADAEDGDDPQAYGSLRLGDVDGDARDDVCGHRFGTVQCALSNGTDFDPPSVWADGGWTAALSLPTAQLGQTLMLGDIDGDGAEDLCERGATGVYCAISDPASAAFVDRAMRSQGEYSDALGWSGAEGYWRTLRLGDLSGDGRADLCGRGGAGVLCLHSLAGRFAARNHLLSPDFSNAAGFLPVERAATIAMADIDGDGRADFCAAGATDLECAVLDDLSEAPEPGFGVMLGFGVIGLTTRRKPGPAPQR